MSLTFEDFSGKIILVAQLEAQPDSADKVEAALKAIRENALSDAEPECLTYRIVRYQHRFVIYEEYLNAGAIKHHNQQKAFVELMELARTGNVLAKPADLRFYQEIKY